MNWNLITDIILVAALATLGVFAALGIYQLITRKSLKKVDRPILAFIPPLIFMAATYLIFERIWIINTRPDGSGEPSFPSTHTMIVATIFFMTILALPKYIKNKALRIVLAIIMLALVAIIAIGRILANKHWPSDVVAGIVFSAIFAVIYYFISKPKKESHA